MSAGNQLKVSVQKLVVKLSVLLMLLIFSAQVIANCQSDQAQGWNIWTICAANFDAQGEYTGSTCQNTEPPNIGQNSANMCMAVTLSDGRQGCTGSSCEFTW
jgi:hypothetical protein